MTVKASITKGWFQKKFATLMAMLMLMPECQD